MKYFMLLMIAFCATSMNAQNPTAFACTGSDGFGYYTSSASSSQSGSTLTYASSRISKLTTSTGTRVTLCTAATIGVALNGLAFNPHDNFLYAVSRYDATKFSGVLYRIGENCQKLEIPVTGGIIKFTTNNMNTLDASGGNISSATFDLDNNYYVNTSYTNASSTGFTNKLQKIALNGSTANVVSTVTLTCPSCTGTNRLRVTDIIFDEASGSLYGNNKETNKLYSINPANGVLTEVGSTGITTSILGMYKNKDGNVRAINEAGNIYGVNVSTGLFSFLITASTLNSGNADAASGCYAPPRISGHLYIDANGLTDNTVNGSPTNKAGITIMYVNLVKNGIIEKSDIIDIATGYYQFLGLFSGQYEVQLSNTKGIIGSAPPAQNLPSNYIFTGENIGTSAGNDGTADGKISLTIANGADLDEVNFGINGKPQATDITGPATPNPGGAVQLQVPTLIISDPEESAINNVTIQLIPNTTTMGTLYYNGIAVTPGQFIPSYNASLLTFDPIDGNVTMVFTYITTDMAGATSNEATVSQQFTAALPIRLTSFEAWYNGKTVDILWSTSSEINNDYFSVMKSKDGIAFWEIDQIESKGNNSKRTQNYSLEDKEISGGLTYYRLDQLDYDGSRSSSGIVFVKVPVLSQFNIYPTMVEDVIFIDRTGVDNLTAVCTIVDYQGRVLLKNQMDGDHAQISVSALPSGHYVLVINDPNGASLVRQKIMKL